MLMEFLKRIGVEERVMVYEWKKREKN